MFNFLKQNKIRKLPAKDFKLDNSDVNYLVNNMDDKEFSEYFTAFIANMFRKAGYEVEILDGFDDKGIDLRLSKKNEIVAVQLKQHSIYKNTLEISKQTVSDFRGSFVGRDDYTKGYFITTHYFTDPAKKLENEFDDLKLYDRQGLFKLIAEIEPEILADFSYRLSINDLDNCSENGCNGKTIKLFAKSKKKYYTKCLMCKKIKYT